ncbi:hypothetical protein MRX96_011951 [Rhipicephalus microplus]
MRGDNGRAQISTSPTSNGRLGPVTTTTRRRQPPPSRRGDVLAVGAHRGSSSSQPRCASSGSMNATRVVRRTRRTRRPSRRRP